MKKARTSGERIKKLRGSRTQVELARDLGVKRAAVSAWEGDDKLRRPSAAIYLKLAALATDPEDSRWFLREAGIDERVIFSAAEKMGLGKSIAPQESEIVRVPALGAAGSEDIGDILLPRSLIPNPNFARYFIAGEYATQLVLAPGVVVIDTSDSGNLIRPFLGEVVLVHLFGWRTEHRSPLLAQDYLMGKVWTVDLPHVGMAAVLGGPDAPRPVEGVYLGHESGLAEDIFSASRGIHIEGRVVAWIARGKDSVTAAL